MTLFAYGNTGAGKTYTMEGCPGCPGMIPQSLAYLFARLSLAALQKRGLLLSFLEIYNEKVYDLLVTQNASGQMPDLAIREDAHKNILVPHMTKVPVTTLADFERWWAIGRRNRSTAATKLNAQSSRSHSILMLQLDASLFCDVSEDVRQAAAPAKLHLIDLAGSEDNRKTDNTGVRLLESTSINTSLFVLGKVVDALNQQQKSAAAGQKTASAQQLRIPYRDSKLTRLLQDSLGGKAIAVMIANVSPLMAHFHETLNTLTFAAKSKQISNVVQMAHWKEARKRRRSIESVPETLAAVADSPSAPVSSQTRGKPTEHALDSLFSSEQQGKHPIALLQQEQLLQRKLEDLLRQKLQDGQGFLTPILEKKLSKSASLVGGGHAPSLLQRHLKKRLCGAQAHAPQMTEFMTPTTRGKTARSIVTKALQIESLAAVSCGSDKWHSALHNYKLALKLLPTNEKLLRKIAYIERQLSGGGAAIENSPMIRPPTKRRKNGHCRASEKSLDDEGAEGKSGSSPVPFSYPAPPRAIKEMDSGALGTYTETCLLALLNFGGKKHVMQLPGIGAKRFEKLEGERNRHGSFYTVTTRRILSTAEFCHLGAARPRETWLEQKFCPVADAGKFYMFLF